MAISGSSIAIPITLISTQFTAASRKVMGSLRGITGSVSKTAAGIAAFGAVLGWLAFRQMRKAVQEVVLFQKEMIGLTKILGADIAGPIGSSVERLSERLPVARAELIEVAETAARLGIRGSGNILKFTETMAKMGIATNITAEHAADAMARIAKQTGLPVEKLENLGSVINELSNTMATSTSEIVDSMRRSVPELVRLGLTADQMAALSATLNTVSESATRAGTRLRRFAQTLTDPDKVKVFAEALGVIPVKFRQMLEDDPAGVILQIVEAMKEGGQAADILASGLDARVRLAIAALATVTDDLRDAFGRANSEMRTNVSLNAEVERILGLVVSKKTMIENKIKAIRRQMGEGVLPLYAQWLTLVEKILSRMQNTLMRLGVIENPLKEMFDPALVEDFEEAIRGFEARRRVSITPRGVRFPMRALAEQSRAIQDAFVTIANQADQLPLFQRQFFRAITQVVADNSAGADQIQRRWDDLFVLWGQTASAMAAAPDEFGKTLTLRGRQLTGMLNELQGKSSLEIYLRLSEALRDMRREAEQFIIAAGGTPPIFLTGAQLALVEEFDDKLKSLQVEFDEARGRAQTFAEEIRSSQHYIDAATDIAKLEAKTEDLTEAEIKLLENLKLFIDAFEGDKGLIARWAELTEKQRKWSEGTLKSTLAAQALNDELEQNAQAISFLNDLNRDMSLLPDFEKEALDMINYVDSLTLVKDNIKDILKTAIENWRKLQESIASGEDFNAVQKRIEQLKKNIDLSTIDAKFRLLERVISGLADSTMEFFEAIITGSGNAGEAMINMIRDVAAELLRSQLMNFFLGFLGPGKGGLDVMGIRGTQSAGGSTVPNFPSSLGGGPARTGGPELFHPHAEGGPVKRSQLAIVGEKGPELFVPELDGQVITNKQLMDVIVKFSQPPDFNAIDNKTDDVITGGGLFDAPVPTISNIVIQDDDDDSKPSIEIDSDKLGELFSGGILRRKTPADKLDPTPELPEIEFAKKDMAEIINREISARIGEFGVAEIPDMTAADFDFGTTDLESLLKVYKEGIQTRATGGSLDKGQLSVVGEKGPELFVPDVKGTVVPNKKLPDMGSNEVHITNHYTIQALDGASVRDILVREQKTIAGMTLDTIGRHRALSRGIS